VEASVDVFGVIFVPFFAAAATAIFGTPIAAIHYSLWRVKAARGGR